MATLQRVLFIDITADKFIDNCSIDELREVIMLANTRLLRGTPGPVAGKALPVAVPKTARAKAGAKKTAGWAPEEEAMLRELWPAMCGFEIAEKLHRDYKTVMGYAKKIGLCKKPGRQAVAHRQAAPAPAKEKEEKPGRQRATHRQVAPAPVKQRDVERHTDCIGAEIGIKSKKLRTKS
ncbi:MAG: hypothetical protein LBN98_03645 [Prevotellaceae bacterium]|jgi:hypothetical protein|nr:hypothetical protein [Prevotellaceae bacterium]